MQGSMFIMLNINVCVTTCVCMYVGVDPYHLLQWVTIQISTNAISVESIKIFQITKNQINVEVMKIIQLWTFWSYLDIFI